jgi:myo-inositol-1(or 4)-monophosphatase
VNRLADPLGCIDQGDVKVVAAMDSFEEVARRAVAEAAQRLRATWRGQRKIEYKGAIDLVTETDREIEALIVGKLRGAFPDHLIVAEEAVSSGSEKARPRGDQYAWYLDPLDGTTNFAHAHPQFAVSLALARGSRLELGIVVDPIRDETFFARRGAGAQLNGERIAVSHTRRLEHSLLASGFPYDRRERADFYLAFFKAFMLRSHGIRRAGAAALDLCYLACGRFDGFWEWKLQPWDMAAGVLIIREAGGAVTDFAARDFDLYGQQILASNGNIHAEMVEVLGEVLKC